MKYFLFTGFIISCLFYSCKKSDGGVANFMLVNGTYSVNSLTAAINGTAINASPLTQGQYSGTIAAPYNKIPPGTNNLTVSFGTTIFLDKNIYTGSVNGYSLLIYDTSASIVSPNYLFLTDDLTKPDTSLVKFRFIYTMPGDSIDFLLTKKTDSTKADSVANIQTFIGNNPTAASLQSFGFTPKHGTYKPFIFNHSTAQLLYTSDSITMGKAQIISFIYSGLPNGTGNSAPKFTMIVHPPN